MCRIFAMAAPQSVPPVIKSRLLREFFQSSAETYSGGWGIGYFTDHGPMVMKEPIKATDSFALPGAMRRTEPGFVMAHVRNPTSGERNLLNTHPFQKDGWLFSHNGTLGDPHSFRARLLERYADTLQGDTDSEVMFHYLLQRIEQAGQAETGVLSAVQDMCRDQSEGTSSLNFALTDGAVLFVLRKAFINDEKYPMNFANLQTLDMTGRGEALRGHDLSSAVVVSSEPFTPGEWSSLEMGEMLIAKADGHRVVKV
ncbi:MAG TPA: class II glutamine amidotransferase [Methanomassiliicoccales archaeon]|jgi:glutamine amidotransferase